MKTLLRGIVAAAFLGAGLHGAWALDKVNIKVQKKQDSLGTEKAADSNASEAKGSDTIHYEFTVENPGLTELQQLTVSYVIFVERPKLGSKVGEPAHVDRIGGSKTIDTLTNRAPQTVASNPIKLGKQDVVGGYTYNNGGRMKAVDNVVGVWVRVMQNGQVIGEHTQPPTVTKRGWDTKSPSENK
jgi:hypothetical protein